MASFSSSAAGSAPPSVGILASQGGFELHRRAFAAIGVEAREVRTPLEIEHAAALVIPGGESTTVMKAIERDSLAEPIADLAQSGRPVLGTCAGAIVLDREHLGLLNVHCERNAYGRQIASFEADMTIAGCGQESFRGIFIRAPKIRDVGPGVGVLASHAGDPVLVRQGNLLAATFHPELAGDERLHAMFGAMIGAPAPERAR